MAARIDSGIDPKFFEEFKQAIATVFELREAMIMTSKQQISVEVNGAASKTLVDLAGNEMKLAAAVKETKVGYDSLEVSLNRVASLKAQYNGSTDTLIGLEKKLNSAEKELELAMLARAKADTEASKQYLLNKQAEKVAAETLFIERKRQITEELELDRLIREEEKLKQAEILKTAEANKVARDLSGPAIVPSRLEELSAMEEADNIAGEQRIQRMLAENAEVKVAAQAERDLAASKRQVVVATNEETISERTNITAKQKLIQENILIKQSLADVAFELKANKTAFDSGKISGEEYQAKTLALTEQQILLKNELAASNAQLKEQGVVTNNASGLVGKFTNIVERMGLRMVANLLIFQAGIELVQYFTKRMQESAEGITEYDRQLEKSAQVLEKWNSAKQRQNTLIENDIKTTYVGDNAQADENIKKMERQLELLKAQQETGRNALKDKEANKKIDKEVFDLEQNIVKERIKINANAQLTVSNERGFANGARGEVLIEQLRSLKSENDDLQNQLKVNEARFNTKQGDKYNRVTKPHDYTSEELAAQKELIDETAKLNADQFSDEVDHNKHIIDNQKATEQERLEALEAYYVAKSKTDQINNQKELDETSNLLTKIKEIEGKSQGSRTVEENNLLLHKSGLLKRAERLEFESDSIQNKNDEEYYAQKRKIVEDGENDNYQSVLNGLKKIDASYQEAYNSEKTALDDKHTRGTISEKKYQEELLNINRKYAKEILQAQIDNLKDLVVLFPEGSEQAQKLIDKIAELQKKLNETKSTGPRKGVLGFSDEDLKLLGEITTEVELYTQAVNKLNDALNAQSKARIDAIQKEIDAIEKRKQTDIDAVTAAAETGVITADEKARRIAAINAKAQQEEDNRNQKIASEKRQAAERDKALAIAEIVIKTALAVVNQLGGGDPYSAIPRAIAVGVLGAAELAAAIATPIPEFWKGTENAPKGLAKLGEKGAELVIPKSGSPWLADKEMIANLQGGEVIKTHTETMEIMKMFGLGMPGLRPGQKDQNAELLEELQESREVLKAIRDKRFPSTPAKPSWWDHYYYTHTK